MSTRPVQILPEWRALKLDERSGVLLVVGATDTGKSTFARYLFAQLRSQGRKAAFFDGDPGQSSLGPPATLTLTFDPDLPAGLQVGDGLHHPAPALVWRYFIGSITPQGHMLPVLVGAARLVQAAQNAGAEVVIYDTSGLVEPAKGGLALKNAKLDLLRPSAVFAIQREKELEPLLIPLRRSQRAQLIELRPSPAVTPRDASARRQHRARQFAAYFSSARPVDLEWSRIAVFPYPAFQLHRLAAFEDVLGFTLGLGIVLSMDGPRRQVRLLTPLRSLAGVNAVRLGDVLVNPETFQDERVMG
jgi:polynucleotide 5'-hydroxyl-kinase GRC3/NOL9